MPEGGLNGYSFSNVAVPESFMVEAANTAAASDMAAPLAAALAGAQPAGTVIPLTAGHQAGLSLARLQSPHAASSTLGVTSSGAVTADRTPNGLVGLDMATSVDAVTAAQPSTEPAGLMNGVTPAATATVLYLGPGLDSFTPAPASLTNAMTAVAHSAPNATGASISSTEIPSPAQSLDWSRSAPLFPRLVPRISAADLGWPSDPAWYAPEQSQAPSPDERSIPADPIVLKAPRLPLGLVVKNHPSQGDIRDMFLTALFDEDFLDRPHRRGWLGPAVDDAIAREILAARTTLPALLQDRSIPAESDGNGRPTNSNSDPSAKPAILRLADVFKSLVLVAPWLTRIWPPKSLSGTKKMDEEAAG